MRLIDADELIEIAKKDKAVNGALADLKDIKDIINAATTIETEPVKHGKWIDKGMAVECSNCGEEYSDELFFMGGDINCCPNCGVKMEE